MKQNKPKAIILFGPTASGKTDLAIKIANKFNGEIINADSRQFYKEMPIITAMPTDEEFAAAPHHLFEILNPEEDFSVADYLDLARKTSEEIISRGKLPIFVGGSGLYLKVLEKGISPIPATESKMLEELEKYNSQELYEFLKSEDFKMAEKLKPNDRQRVMRALAVVRQTGISLLEWQQKEPEGALDYDFINMVIKQPREVLYNRINTRANKMLETGLMSEVETLYKKYKDLRINSLTSIGFVIFVKFFKNEITQQEAIDKFAQKQRNYAKRQLTWLKNQFNVDFEYKDVDSTFEFLQRRLLDEKKGTSAN